jgi:hypothetical protein
MALRWAIACRLALAPGGWQISAVAGCDVRSVTVRPILADEVGRFNAELDAHHCAPAANPPQAMSGIG